MANVLNGRLRIVVDAGVVLSIIALAFYAGVLTQQVNDLREAVTTRGRVMISIEASERLTVLENNARRQDMRLLEIENQLRNRN